MKIFIGCGSNPKINDLYLNETRKVCNMLCQNNYNLVFGAYSKGMMGICYNEFLKNKKEVDGITIKAYEDDLENLPNTNITVLDTSFERTKEIFNISDLFLILPGGTGSLSELFSLMEALKTSLKKKKVILYNYNNYYTKLIDFLYESKEKGFIYETDLNNLIIIGNIKDLEGEIKNERN